MTTHFDIRNAGRSDLADVQVLLREAALPFEDLSADAMQDFVVVTHNGGTLIGAGGIERYDSDGLLRSVVVHESMRGSGMGNSIVTAVEQRARNNGVSDLYLLTTTAAEFFPRLGYARFERKHVPEKLQHSTEFASLCPASAVCLHKKLK